MTDSLIHSLIAALALLVAAGALWSWTRNLALKREDQRRAQGYRLIHSLNAYSAWIECQRDLSFTATSLDELTSPEPLTIARQIKRTWFPALHEHTVRLLQSHSRLIEYLWQQSLLRLSQGAGWRPAYQDPLYQQLRGAQEELIEEMIEICREICGDGDRVWERTGSDFAFSNSFSVSSQGPANRA